MISSRAGDSFRKTLHRRKKKQISYHHSTPPPPQNYDSSYRITVSTSEVSTSSCSSGSLGSSSLKHFLYAKGKNLLINGQNFSLLSHLKIFRMTCPATGYRGIAHRAMAYQVWHERNLGVKAKNIYYESYL